MDRIRCCTGAGELSQVNHGFSAPYTGLTKEMQTEQAIHGFIVSNDLLYRAEWRCVGSLVSILSDNVQQLSTIRRQKKAVR